MNYYVLLENEQRGPYTLTQLMAMWSTGQITSETMHWFEGLTEWIPLGSFVADEIAQEMADQVAKKTRLESARAALAKGVSGWGRGEFLALVVLSVLVPFIGFAMGLLNVWNPEKRQQAGQLIAVSVLVFLGVVLVFSQR